MKRNQLIIPAIALLSHAALAQTPVDMNLSLQNIEIQGKRFVGLNGGEVKRLQVENNLSSMTGTVSEAFRQMPSLVTDIEGGVTYRGSSKARMLINGVPYGLLEEYSGDVLIQLPALFFNHISMSALPDISLVPDGDAGLLNLSSSYYTKEDSPLTVTLGAGLQERYNAGAVVNLHPGKFHIVGKYNYRREYRKRSFDKTTTTETGTTIMNNNAAARPDVHLADLSVGYDLTSKDLLTVYGLYHLMDYSRYGGINNKVLNPDGSVKNQMTRHRYNDQRQDAYAVEARWNHQFANPLDRLDVTFNYNDFGYDEDNYYENEKPGTGIILKKDNMFINQDKHNYYLSAAFGKSFAGDWYLKAGYIGRIKDEDYKTETNDINLDDDAWTPVANKSYDFSFNRNTHLLYASVDKRWNNFSAEAGLQGELNTQKLKSYDRNTRFRVYPRVELSLQTGKAGSLSLSYLQRVIRPYGADLNPFIQYGDPTHLTQGNPDLKDELIHSLELSYLVTTKHFRLSPALYYRNKSNRIMEVMNEESVWQKTNIGHSQAVGFELSANWSPVRLLNVGFSGNVYRDEIDGRTVGYDEKKSMVCGDLKGSISINITSTTELQMDGFYISDQLTPQGKIKSHSTVNAGLSQYFMNRKLRANLSINNIFDGLEEKTIIDTDKLQMEQIRNRDARVTWLTLTYSL
ncbi:outer membrane beta-barrel family protein [Parabacteroides sp.]